jgi:hypothetical protein
MRKSATPVSGRPEIIANADDYIPRNTGPTLTTKGPRGDFLVSIFV